MKRKSFIKRGIRRVSLSLSKLYPKKFRDWTKQGLIYAGMNFEYGYFLGSAMLLSMLGLLLPIIASLLLYNGIDLIFLGFSGILFAGAQLIPVVIIQLKSLNRARSVEAYLPDMLRLIAANARSGMTPFAAIRSAARKEFKVLSEEIKRATTYSLGIESYEKVLAVLTAKIDSVVLKRIVQLLGTGMRTGGNIPELLEGAAVEITKTQALKTELITSARSYMMFILLVVVAGLPFLLTISSVFVKMIIGLQGMIGTSELTPTVIKIQIGLEYLNIMSYVVIILTVLFASLLMGSITEGKFVQGLKYFPVLLIVSIIVYNLAMLILPQFLGNITL